MIRTKENQMNTITRIRELDTYLVTFMDQNTIYNYCTLSKDTNRIVSEHVLFGMLKRYSRRCTKYGDILMWAIIKNKILILDWCWNTGYKFNNVFVLVHAAIVRSRIQILDWFYQKGIFDYTLVPLHEATLTGSIGSINWFYEHSLETSYLDGLLSDPGTIIENINDHRTLLAVLKWFHKKNYPIKINFDKLRHVVTVDSLNLLRWILDNGLIEKSVFSNENYIFSLEMTAIDATRQIETLTFLKNLKHHFKWIEKSLANYPIETIRWCMENIPNIDPRTIFEAAALENNISVMDYTGINKDHPDFGLIDHARILKKAINKKYMNVITWYSKNIIFDHNFLSNLYNVLEQMRNIPIEIIMLLEEHLRNNKLFFHLNQDLFFYPNQDLIYQKFVEAALVDENIPVLEYVLTKLPSGMQIHIHTENIANCIWQGHINTLKWLEKYIEENRYADSDKESKIKIIDDENADFKNAIFYAICNHNLDAIKWAIKFFPQKINYENAINHASNKIEILNWFEETIGNTPNFKYSCSLLDCHKDEIQALDWFHHSSHVLKYSNTAIDNSICFCCKQLEWFKKNKYPMSFDRNSIFDACKAPHIDCKAPACTSLQWLKDNGVIKIMGMEYKDDLLVFKLELAQPFANFKRSNGQYTTAKHWYMGNKYFDVVDVEYDGNTVFDTFHDTGNIEIRYKYKKLTDILVNSKEIKKSYVRHNLYNLNNIYNNLCWFERCYKRQTKVSN